MAILVKTKNGRHLKWNNAKSIAVLKVNKTMCSTPWMKCHIARVLPSGIVLGTKEPFFLGELHYTESKLSLLSVMKQCLEAVARSAEYGTSWCDAKFKDILSTFQWFFTRSITESAECGRPKFRYSEIVLWDWISRQPCKNYFITISGYGELCVERTSFEGPSRSTETSKTWGYRVHETGSQSYCILSNVNQHLKIIWHKPSRRRPKILFQL